MKTILCLAAFVACASAQAYLLPGHEKETDPIYDIFKRSGGKTWSRGVGDNGKIFGTLGHGDSSVFGKAGYQHQIFNDNRGTMDAQAYGTRVLGANGDSSMYGARLDWSNPNAKASVDVSKPVGGHTGISASASGAWDVGKNTHVSAGGFYDQQSLGHGKPDYGVQAEIKHDI